MNPLKIILGFVFAFLLVGLNVQANTVSGTVNNVDGSPANRIRVKAFHQTEELGSASTNSRGQYRISYQADSGITLIVRVYNREGEQLSSSAPVANAGSNTTINITLPLRQPQETRINLPKPQTPVLQRRR